MFQRRLQMKSSVKHWYNKLPEIGYQMKPYVKGGKALLPNRGKGNYDADLYFGRGLKQNGNDQSVTMPINTTVNTIVFFKNGSLVFDETLQTLTDYVTDVTSADIYQNFIFYKGIFEPHEKRYMETNPEKFLYHEKQDDGTFIAKSEILSQEQLDNVVAHFPMCETDGYVRNMIGYSEGENIVTDNSFVDWGSAGVGIVTDNGDGSYTVEVTTATDNQNYPRLNMNQLQDRITGETYRYDVEVVSVDGNSPDTIAAYDGSLFVLGRGEGSFTKVSTVTLDRTVGHFYFDGRKIWKITVRMSEKKLTSTYPIDNFTASCRDKAKNLQTGLQTCFWKRDVLGVPVGSSFKELILSNDSTKGFTTGYIIDDANSFGIEAILEVFSPRRYNYFNPYPCYFSTHGSIDVYIRLNDVSWGENTGVGKQHCYIYYDAVSSELTIAINGIVKKTGTVTKYGVYGELKTVFINDGSLPLLNFHFTPQDPAKLYADALKRGDLS